jgi:hypothetical protein
VDIVHNSLAIVVDIHRNVLADVDELHVYRDFDDVDEL